MFLLRSVKVSDFPLAFHRFMNGWDGMGWGEGGGGGWMDGWKDG